LKLVHAADLHIDSPLRGLERYEGAPAARLRSATRGALENLVALCIDERADALLLAGDIFDGSWKDYSTGLFFAAQMARLREVSIPVVLLRGNHDAASTVIRALRLPDNVRELSSKAPETLEFSHLGLCVHGQGFAQRAVTEDLASQYPERRAGLFNVALLHTSLDGREGHEPYAPTSIEAMRAKGYDYWALGHAHTREIVARDPFIVYPGNLQGRSVRETGPKGASVVTIEDGRVQSVEARPLDVVRWEHVQVDASHASDALEVVDHACAEISKRAFEADHRVLCARVTVVGCSRANSSLRRDAVRFRNELCAAMLDALGDSVWIEKVSIETRAAMDFERLRDEASAVGHLARRLAALGEDADELASLASVLVDLDKKLPAEIREGDGGLRLGEPDTIRALLADAEQMILPRLLERAEA
jgi:exonuclease SbcD